MSKLPAISLQETLLAPLFSLISSCQSNRNCPDLPDEEFLRICLLRALAPQESGRDFLQSLRDVHHIDIQRSQFFQSIKSKRRLDFVLDDWPTIEGRMPAPTYVSRSVCGFS
jgi:hypothetical protein